jgi:tetratricopeptide (TPR) repeat protein
VVVGALVICAIGLSLVAGAWISASQDAAARGDLHTAIDRALQVRSIEPWSSRPYQQLALLQEQAGRDRTARRWIRMAIARDRSDWQLWLIKSRIETELGAIPAATTSIRRIKVLNPHTPLVANP